MNVRTPKKVPATVDTDEPNVGISVIGLESSFYGTVVDAAMGYLRKRGVNAVVHLNDHSRAGELEAWQLIGTNRFDSFILYADHLLDNELSELMAYNPNVVLLNRQIAGFEYRCVSNDCEHGGFLAANYLLNKGHTSLAMVTGPKSFSVSKLRSSGFLNAIARWKNTVPDALVLESDYSEAGGAIAMETIVASNKDISAVFFHNDEMAIGALDYCHKNKIHVPQDYSFVGYDGHHLARFTQPKLTTVRQPLRLIGRESGKIALSLTNSSKAEKISEPQNCFEPTLVEGDSVCQFGDSDPASRLTKREKECLEWTARGKTAWEVSRILNIAERTVNNHLANAFRRLNVTNGSEAIAKSIREGLIDL